MALRTAGGASNIPGFLGPFFCKKEPKYESESKEFAPLVLVVVATPTPEGAVAPVPVAIGALGAERRESVGAEDAD